jgi:hypothetical protein
MGVREPIPPKAASSMTVWATLGVAPAVALDWNSAVNSGASTHYLTGLRVLDSLCTFVDSPDGEIDLAVHSQQGVQCGGELYIGTRLSPIQGSRREWCLRRKVIHEKAHFTPNALSA